MDKLNLTQLKALAKEAGLRGYSSGSKAELIAMLKEAGVKTPVKEEKVKIPTIKITGGKGEGKSYPHKNVPASKKKPELPGLRPKRKLRMPKEAGSAPRRSSSVDTVGYGEDITQLEEADLNSFNKDGKRYIGGQAKEVVEKTWLAREGLKWSRETIEEATDDTMTEEEVVKETKDYTRLQFLYDEDNDRIYSIATMEEMTDTVLADLKRFKKAKQEWAAGWVERIQPEKKERENEKGSSVNRVEMKNSDGAEFSLTQRFLNSDEMELLKWNSQMRDNGKLRPERFRILDFFISKPGDPYVIHPIDFNEWGVELMNGFKKELAEHGKRGMTHMRMKYIEKDPYQSYKNGDWPGAIGGIFPEKEPDFKLTKAEKDVVRIPIDLLILLPEKEKFPKIKDWEETAKQLREEANTSGASSMNAPQSKAERERIAKQVQKRENLLKGAAKREERKALPENIRYRDRVPAFTERKKVPNIRRDGTPSKKMVPSKKKAVKTTDLKGVKGSYALTERKGEKKPKKITPLQPANRFNTPLGDEAFLRARAMKAIGKPDELFRRDNVKDREVGKILGMRGTEIVFGKGERKKKPVELRTYNKALTIYEEKQAKSKKKVARLKNLTERDREKQGYKKPIKITELKGLPEKKNTEDYKQIDTGKSSGRPKKVLDTTVETKPAFLISSYIDKPEPRKRANIFHKPMREDFFWDKTFGY